MALSALLFLYFQLNAKEERSRLVFVIAFFCTAISCFSYFAMASGYGVFVTANGGLIFWARYVHWMITQHVPSRSGNVSHFPACNGIV